MIEISLHLRVNRLGFHGILWRNTPRPEFMALLKLANTVERPIATEDVANELLAGDHAVAAGLLQYAINLKLLHGTPDAAELTEEGRQSLASAEIAIPESGIWRIHVMTVSPFRREQRLGVQSVKDRNEIQSLNDREGTGLHECDYANTPFRPLFGETRITRMEPNTGGKYLVSPIEASECEMTLRWQVGQRPKLAITYAGCDAKVTEETEPDELSLLAGTDPRTALIPRLIEKYEAEMSSASAETSADWLSRLSQNPRSLMIGRKTAEYNPRTALAGVRKSFNELTEAERRTHRTSLSFKIPLALFYDDPELAQYEDRRATVSLTEIPVLPATQEDAEAWLHWHQWDEIRDYVVPDTLARHATDSVAKFPEFADLVPLTTEQMLAAARTELTHPKRRHLLAAHDLGLWN